MVTTARLPQKAKLPFDPGRFPTSCIHSARTSASVVPPCPPSAGLEIGPRSAVFFSVPVRASPARSTAQRQRRTRKRRMLVTRVLPGGRLGALGVRGRCSPTGERLRRWGHEAALSMEALGFEHPDGSRDPHRSAPLPPSDVDEQRVTVEPDRPTAFRDDRGVSRRDVDNEDAATRAVGGRANDPGPVGGPGSRGSRVSSGQTSQFAAVDVGPVRKV
jgi:hypothetical protein